MSYRDLEAAWAYHEGTKHSPYSIRASRHFLDWENQPLPYKIYLDLEPIPLLRDLGPSAIPALSVLRREVSGRARGVCSRAADHLAPALLLRWRHQTGVLPARG
jgi:hypothetical protein